MKTIKPCIKSMMLLLSVTALIVTSCHGKQVVTEETLEVEEAVTTRGSIDRTILFTGNIEAESAAAVFPRAQGKVSKLIIKEGERVRKGEAIMLVDRDEVGFTFKAMPIVSPIDGLVGRVEVDVGDSVNPAQAVATVVKSQNVKMKIDVPERYLEDIRIGEKASMIVDSLGGIEFNGSIISRSPFIDEKTRTARVEVSIPNPDGKLQHGMFGRINIAVEQNTDILKIPYPAISWEGAKKFVYKIDGSKLVRTEVKIGLRNDLEAEVTEGLAERDIIAVGSLIDMKDGETVTIKTKEQK